MRQNRLRKKALSALLALSLFSTPLLTAQAAGPVDYSEYNTAGTAGYSGPLGSNPHGSPAELILTQGTDRASMLRPCRAGRRSPRQGATT